MTAYLAPDPDTGDLLVESVLCDYSQSFTPDRPGDYTAVRPHAAAAATAHTATHTAQPDTGRFTARPFARPALRLSAATDQPLDPGDTDTP